MRGKNQLDFDMKKDHQKTNDLINVSKWLVRQSFQMTAYSHLLCTLEMAQTRQMRFANIKVLVKAAIQLGRGKNVSDLRDFRFASRM